MISEFRCEGALPNSQQIQIINKPIKTHLSKQSFISKISKES